MSKSLLFVDDSATMQTVAEITFRGSDWEFAGVRNAADARPAASGKSLILVDAVMPDCSGYDLAKELRAANPSATVVMVCGNSEAYDAGKGAAAGCAGHIIKPWQTDKVVEQLLELESAAPAAGAAAPAAAAVAPTPTPAPPIPAPRAPEPSAPRSATLMGMPALEMPMTKPLPAGVAAIKTSKPAIPDLKPAVAVKPAAAPPDVAAPVAAAPAARAPMVSGQPGKPIRLVLASQAEAAAKQSAQGLGLDGAQADALGSVSRELLERIIWEVVPELAEAIIRENLDTLTAKTR